MGEIAPKPELTPRAEILRNFRIILAPAGEETGKIDKREFGNYSLRHTATFTGYRRDIRHDNYELVVTEPNTGETQRYNYQAGYDIEVFVDGQSVELHEGERKLQVVVKEALEVYEGRSDET